MKRLTGAVLAIVLLGPVFATSGMAQDGYRDWRGRPGPDRFHARQWGPPGAIRGEFRRPPDEVRWRTGRWVHDWHDNRLGWWWVVDGFWYLYPQPVHPYPAYAYAPPPPAAPVPPGTPVFWYYCSNPPGYYPNVPVCPGGWYTVTPPG